MHGGEEQAARPALLWAAGPRRPEVKEALWLLDGHNTVTGVLTKLTKPSVPVNLVGPQVSLPLYWVPANRGSILFLVRNKGALPCVRRYSWWVRAVNGGNVFSQNTEALSVGP